MSFFFSFLNHLTASIDYFLFLSSPLSTVINLSTLRWAQTVVKFSLRFGLCFMYCMLDECNYITFWYCFIFILQHNLYLKDSKHFYKDFTMPNHAYSLANCHLCVYVFINCCTGQSFCFSKFIVCTYMHLYVYMWFIFTWLQMLSLHLTATFTYSYLCR